MSTFLEIASDASSVIGQTGIGQTISPEEAAQAMRFANRMLAKWSAQRLFLPDVNTRSYGLTSGLQDYVVGPTASGPGSFVQSRPMFVENARAVIPGTSTELDMNLLSKVEWDAIRDKQAQTSVTGTPSDIWTEPSFPNMAFHVWPVPSVGVTIKIGTWELLQQFATVFDVVNLPPEYEDALVFNLAIALAPTYEKPVTQDIQDKAVDGILKLQALNAQTLRGAIGANRTLQVPNLDIPPPTGPAPGGPQ